MPAFLSRRKRGDDVAELGLTGFAAEVFDGPRVELPQMLDAREHRASEQARLIAEVPGASSLLCVTMAIPGPVKTSRVLKRVFDHLMALAVSAFGAEQIVAQSTLGGPTGTEALLLTTLDARKLKRLMVKLEESDPCGRLVDLDVFDCKANGLRPLTRTELGFAPRTCLICGGEAKACARSRTHSVKEMQEKIAIIIQEGGFEDCGKQSDVH